MSQRRLVKVLLSCAVLVALLAVVSPAWAADSTISINAGGSASGSFTADQYFSGGTTYTNTNTVDELADHEQRAPGRDLQLRALRRDDLHDPQPDRG
jgi:hypothetical protein